MTEENTASPQSDEPQKAEIILYQSDGANVPVEVRYMQETFWLTQKEIAALFQVNVPAISKHLSNIYEEGELDQRATVSKMEIVQQEGNRQVKRNVDFYNLDAIIAVGYRVNSLQTTRFRQWATSTLKVYIQKGYALNVERLKNGAPFGEDCFDELIAIIRDIRASERCVWQKLTNTFQEWSFDYDKNSQTARDRLLPVLTNADDLNG